MKLKARQLQKMFDALSYAIKYSNNESETAEFCLLRADVHTELLLSQVREKESADMYYVRNAGFVGNAFIWWAKDRSGYTTDINNAHKFTLEEAKSVCDRPQDTAFKCSCIDGLTDAKKTIIDSQYVDRVEELFKPIK